MRWTADQMPDLTGRRALVTGANSGIGYVEALELARHGADVVLAVRNPDAGAAAVERIRAAGVSGTARLERLDLASLDSVQALAERFEGPLDLLVNNAGVMAPPRHRTTADGFELQLGTNHLGHFALTGLLLPHLLEATHTPRHHRLLDRPPFRRPQGGRGQPGAGLRPAGRLRPLEARQRSLRARAAPARHGIRLATHVDVGAPGSVGHQPLRQPRRDGARSRSSAPSGGGECGCSSRPQAQGAEAVLYAATVAAPGSYSGPTSMRETRGAVGEARLSTWAQDEALAALLWQRSEELTGVSFHL